MKRSAIAILFALTASFTFGQNLDAVYLEGDVRIRNGSEWIALSTGDRVSPDATLQLSDVAYIELKWTNAKIVLSQRGVYSVRKILASTRTIDAAGAGKALMASLSHLATEPVPNRSAAAGVRGADESGSSDTVYITSSAQMFLDSGRQFVRSGQYEKAIEQFTLALDAATTEELPEVRYHLAHAHALNGDTRDALKLVADLAPGGGDEWAPDFIILKAKLYVDSNAFAQEIAWLTRKENDLSRDAQRAALYYFLLGVGYRGTGDTSSGNASLLKVVTISGESDLGRSAAQLLQNP